MKIDIRTQNGKKLFEWNPQQKTITIVVKQHRYRVELADDCDTPNYNVSEEKKCNT